MGCGLSLSYILYPFLLALYINFAANMVKLGVSRAYIRGGGEDTGAVIGCMSMCSIYIYIHRYIYKTLNMN